MFQDTLNRAMTHVEGAQACLLIGLDGVPVASVFADDAAEDGEDESSMTVAVELSNLMGTLRRLNADGEVGEIASMSLDTNRLKALAHVVQDEYLLILTLDPEADGSQGARMLRLITPWVEQQM